MISENVKKFVSSHWSLILLVTISVLLPAIWLRERLVIGYAEPGFMFLIKPFTLFNLSKYAWWDVFGLGLNNPRALPLSSYYWLVSILQVLGTSALLRQYLVFSTVLLASSLSVYFLTLELWNSKEQRVRFLALLVALFYVLNPYSMNVWHRFTSAIFGLPLMPLIFLVTVRMLKRRSFGYTFLFALTTLLFSVNAVNPGYFIPLFLPAILYIIFETIRTRSFRQWKYFGLATLLAIGLNVWWLLPLSSGIKEAYTGVTTSLPGTLEMISGYIPILYIARLIDMSTVHWYGVAYNPGWVEFLLPLLAGVAFLVGSRRNKNILLFGLLLVIGVFFSKGLQPPGDFVYRWMFDHVPFFEMFRSPFEKFGLLIAFSYSFLVPLGIVEVQRKLPRFINSAVLMVIIVLLFGFSVWPMWTGDVFSFAQGAVPTTAQDVPTARVEVPAYWERATDYINRDRSDYRIVFLPQSPFDMMSYRWKHGYAGADFGSVGLLFEKPVVSQVMSNPDVEDFRLKVFRNVFRSQPEDFPKFLGLMNAKYIVFRGDVNETAMPLPVDSPSRVRVKLSSIRGIKKEKSYGELEIYRLSDEFYLPRIYAATEPVVLIQGLDSFVKGVSSSQISKNRVFLFLTTRELKEFVAKKESLQSASSSPKIAYRRINPTLYKIRVSGGSSPFYLVFLESFHSGWMVYSGDVNWLEALRLKPIEENKHLRANGYANSWYIDKKGDFEMTLYFWPQSLVYIGAIFSAFTFMGCVLLLMWKLKSGERFKRRKF